jgi:VanZ family protein
MSRTAQRVTSQRFLRYWLPVVLYVCLIFFVSAQPYLRPPLHFNGADKVAHLIEYGILGALLGRAVSASWKASRTAVALFAICIGIVVGTCDELFQSTVPGRQSSGFDLMADAAGVAIAQIVSRALARA